MIRVLHLVVAGEVGGAEHMLRSLATAKAGPDAAPVAHFAYVCSPDDTLPRFLSDGGVTLVGDERIDEAPLAFAARTLGAEATKRVAAAVVRVGAQVVQLHTFQSQVLGTRAAKRAGVRVVRTEHSTRVYDDPSCWPFSRWSLARADAVVAISAHVRDAALARMPAVAPRIRVIYNGIDTEHFAPDRHAPFPADDAPFSFVLVGRLEPRKGVDRAIDALTLVPGAHLHVVGDGALRGDYAHHASARGVAERVTFHGALADVRPVVARADAALAASRKEGLGIAFLEAMAMGKPLVTVPVGGLVEIVQPGLSGLLAESDTPEALAAAMREMAADRLRSRALGAAARTDVVDRFSLATMCARYASLYSSLAAPASS